MNPRPSRWNAENFGTVLVKLIVAGLLVWALSRHPYSYYTLLRWATFAASVFIAVRASKGEKAVWFWVFIIIAVVFNPVLPIHLKRDTWAIIDLAAAAVFLVSIVFDVRRGVAK